MSAVFTIAPQRPFVDDLAATLLAESGEDPLTLAATTVLLPGRRVARALRGAFLRQSGGRSLLLPRLLALGDIDEDEALLTGLSGTAALDLPPEMPPLRRQVLLARLILALPDAVRPAHTLDQAVRLAAELARLLDQVQIEGLGFTALEKLAPETYAAHWQAIVTFLRVLTHAWPGLLEAEGCLDPVDRRNRLLRLQAEAWRRHPPAGPVVAAGITGSIPAAAELVAVVATLPQGRVVLPGLDRFLDAESWDHLEESHPQHALRRLLRTLDLEREAVADWPSPCPPEASRTHPHRVRLVSEVMRPAATSDQWRTLTGQIAAGATHGLRRLDTPTPQEEALAIALMLREALETPDRTAALVTPDRDLARRVMGELKRWDVVVDDSAGRPLALTPPGAFLRLCAEMVASGFAPVPLLAVLKHPMAAAGMTPGRFRDLVRWLERRCLRGVRPAPGIAGLRAALSEELREKEDAPPEALLTLLDHLETRCAPFAALMDQPNANVAVLLTEHMRMAERLAERPGLPGPATLWAKDDGEAAALFAADLGESLAGLPPLAPRRWPALFDALMQGQTVRAEHGLHPRLSILGPMEARLCHADLVVIGSLNEGHWPPRLLADPWMSRDMRRGFGLPLPEQRIGHAAHDLASLLCAPEVVLTRAEKVEGTPTVPSRWLLRLETVLTAAGLPPLDSGADWLVWARQMDRPAATTPHPPPAPRPPVEARPTRLSVTGIETWMRDPYALYARFILGLKALDPLDADPDTADYGTLVHAALEAFLRATAGGMPPDPLPLLLDCGREAFTRHISRPAVRAFWWPRFERLAAWVVEQEQERSGRIRQSHVEVSGELDLGGFTLTAKADRIDLLHDGSLSIIDYKTGAPPTVKEVKAGYAPQLPLEAAMAAAGAFEAAGVPGRPVSELLYWRLKGDAGGGEERRAAGKDTDPATLAAEALDGLRGLIAAFSRPETAYESRPNPGMAPKYSDYLHLARVKEWAAGEEGEEGGDSGGEAP